MTDAANGAPAAGTHENPDRFPTRLFAIYYLFYASQAIYNTYLNLYLTDVGVSQPRIGMIVSVSTLCLLAAQPFWGNVSDRAKNKTAVLRLMLLGGALTVGIFYFSTNFWFLMFAVSLFAVFYVPTAPILDNHSLELLEHSRWNFGHVRMGGTVGYAITVFAAGFFFRERYGDIFWMTAALLTACLLLALSLPHVRGYRTGARKTPYREILKNKKMIALIGFSLAFYLGQNFYNNFYLIYFRSIGGTNAQIGLLMFAAAAAEVPCLLFMGRLIRRFGVQRILICAGLVTAVRWLLLFLLKDPAAIILANALHGFGFTAFSYGIITYIGEHVPKDLRATGQSLNSLVSNVFSRVIFGYVGGLASAWFGTDAIMLVSCVIITAATAAFALWNRKSEKAEAEAA